MGDNKKVDQFKNGEYNDVYLSTDIQHITTIKKYIDDLLATNCYLVPSILIKKMGVFIGGVLNVIEYFLERILKNR